MSAFALMAVAALGRFIVDQRQVEAALVASERRYRRLFDASPDMVGIAGLEPGPTLGNWIELNRQTLDRLGYDHQELTRMSPPDLLVDPSVGLPQLESLAADAKTFRFEAELRCKNGDALACDLTAQVIEVDGRPSVLFVVRDISEQRRLADEMKAAYDRLAVAESITHVGSMEWRDGVHPDVWSDETYRLLGVEPGAVEPTFDTFFSFVHPEDREKLLQAAAGAADHGLEDLVMSAVSLPLSRTRLDDPTLKQWNVTSFRIVRADGSERSLEVRVRVRPSEPGHPAVYCATLQDVTVRERAEMALRKLTAHAASAEERERRRIAAELHDRTIQNLGVFRFRLAALREQIDCEKAAQIVDELVELTRSTIADTRRLISELSPPVLRELGLRDALEWLAEGLSERNLLRCRIHTAAEIEQLDEDAELILFQVARELLTNVEKHARAQNVDVRIDVDAANHVVSLSVHDDGIGFDGAETRAAPSEEGGFGLPSIRESLGLLSGSLSIDATPERGTTVSARIPFRAYPRSGLPS